MVLDTQHLTLSTERISRRFYQRFKLMHSMLLASIHGLPSQETCFSYTSLLLHRLLCVYFLQQHGLLNNDRDFLLHLLQHAQKEKGQDMFYRDYLLPLFHKQLCALTPSNSLPPFALPLFQRQALEDAYPHVQIPDDAFARLFAFFNTYQWRLSRQQPCTDNELHLDVLSYIFEQHINQKYMGAYYTNNDVTRYITNNTLVPYFLTTLMQRYPPAAFQSLWRLLQTNPDRYINTSIRSQEYLPEETKADYEKRRLRYRQIYAMLCNGTLCSIEDCITHCLDLHQLALDFIRSCDLPDLVLTGFSILEHMTVLDPTCGSGAFLFSALDTLEPLYAACLERIQVLSQTMPHPELLPFQALLDRAAQSINHNYFILNTIIANNLYGVDLMEEAVNICTLCLYLTLLTHVSRPEDVQPFSSINFNIRSGNALVGCVHSPLSAIQSDTPDPCKHSFFCALPKRAERERNPGDTPETPSGAAAPGPRHKQPIPESTPGSPLTGNCNQEFHPTLSLSYDYVKFKGNRHFHWCNEFRTVIEQGGFNVIIGNPPYVEYSKSKQDYRILDDETSSCGNLYAAVIERSLQLGHPTQSYLGMVVPLSLCGSKRFAQLRNLITQRTSHLWLSNFEIFPSRLFDGAFQRLSIMLARYGSTQQPTLHVSRLHRWYAVERPHLINLIAYTATACRIQPLGFPKLASQLQEVILHKLLARAGSHCIADELCSQRTEHFVYYQEATNYWTKATCRIPFYKKNGLVTEPSHGRFLFFRDATIAHTIMALMNSSLFYVWFATFSDGFHLSHALVKDFPLDSKLYSTGELALLAQRLEQDIKAHSRLSTRNTKPNPRQQKAGLLIELEEYRMSYSKPLLDEIDRMLAHYYGFTDEELDFIINYDSKYRMGTTLSRTRGNQLS